MFKKLDKLIVKAFVGPFVATFFITLLVLVMQFFWLYIDDFVGKGLNPGLIFEFIWYQSAVLVPLALPLSILVSSIMTFGNLGESFELVAIKASGISLLRFMRPLFIVAAFISGIAFLFSNYIIPVAALKSRTLLADIVFAKPAFELKEGVFYDRLSGFAIKVGEKEADSIIRNVVVYENNPVQDNFIIAKSGIMKMSEDKRFLLFNLKDGWRYQERTPDAITKNTEYVRLGFKEYKKQFDLSDFQFVRSEDSLYKNHERMLSLRQLSHNIDSLKKQHTDRKKQWSDGLFASQPFQRYLTMDSVWKKINYGTDTLVNKKVKSFSDWLPDSLQQNIEQQTESEAGSIKSIVKSNELTMQQQERTLRLHQIEWHRKITLSLACLVLFLIGAPLGSIIRKGGVGTPLIFGIIFFMLFYFSTTTGEKFAKENSLTPFAGMWLATFVLVPIGLFLTYKAMRDSQLFNKERYVRVFKKIKQLFAKS